MNSSSLLVNVFSPNVLGGNEKSAVKIVVVSNYLKEHLVNLGISHEKIIVLTNAADPEVFCPLEKKVSIMTIKTDSTLRLLVQLGTPEEDHRDIISHINSLNQTYPIRAPRLGKAAIIACLS